MCLQAHYRSELEFSWEGLQAALTRLKRMVMGVQRMRAKANPSALDVAPAIAERMKRFDEAISDDLNTSVALALMEGTIDASLGASTVEQMLEQMDAVLGLQILSLSRADLRLRPKDAVISEVEIDDAIVRRKAARAEKDFAASDAIRDDLAAQGIEMMDGDPLGWEWKLD
jgi:cysteinyl-tRNA synthetase